MADVPIQNSSARNAPVGEASDLSLVAGVRARDESAMAGLYDRYSSLVYAVALRVLGDTGQAEDVLQEIFMQLWRSPSRSIRHVAAWERGSQ